MDFNSISKKIANHSTGNFCSSGVESDDDTTVIHRNGGRDYNDESWTSDEEGDEDEDDEKKNHRKNRHYNGYFLDSNLHTSKETDEESMDVDKEGMTVEEKDEEEADHEGNQGNNYFEVDATNSIVRDLSFKGDQFLANSRELIKKALQAYIKFYQTDADVKKVYHAIHNDECMEENRLDCLDPEVSRLAKNVDGKVSLNSIAFLQQQMAAPQASTKESERLTTTTVTASALKRCSYGIGNQQK